jgi:tetratricopeptide (TPR) repeat protein
MKRYLLFIGLVFSSCFAFAQNKNIDSLLTLLKTNKEDTNKVITLNEIAWELYKIGSYDTAIMYADTAKTIAMAIGYKKGIVSAHNKMGNDYEKKGNYPLALKNHITCLKLCKEMGNKKSIASCYNNIGIVYYNQGNYPEALKNYYASLKLFEEIGNEQGIAQTYNGIGNIYKDQHNYPEALKNHFASLKIKEKIGDKVAIAFSYDNIGNIYYYQKKISEALKNYYAALKIQEEVGDKKSISDSYNNIGNCYADQGNYQEALKSLSLSLKIREQIGDKQGLARSLGNIGEIYKDLKNYQEAEKYINKALVISIEINSKDLIKDDYIYLSIIDSAKGDYKAAYEHYKMYFIYNDSIYNEENAEQINSLSAKYESEKKEKEIAVLKVEQTITEDEHKRKQLIYASISILITIMAFFILNWQRLKSKKDKIIFEKQEALLQAEKQKAEDELLHAKKLLDNYTENLIDKNKAIEELQFENEKLKGLKAAELYKEKIDNLDDLNNATILTNEDWEKFKELFEQVYKGFFIRLKDKLPNLTNAEIRLMSLIKLNLDAKQMANMLGVSPETITKTKYRLRKKINLPENQDIESLVQSI